MPPPSEASGSFSRAQPERPNRPRPISISDSNRIMDFIGVLSRHSMNEMGPGPGRGVPETSATPAIDRSGAYRVILQELPADRDTTPSELLSRDRPLGATPGPLAHAIGEARI